MIRTLAVSGYRSLVDLTLELDRLTVVTGPNGSGKSSLYRALRLLAACGSGQVVGALAREGGLGSALWAGTSQAPGPQGRVALRLGFEGDGLGYAVDLGLPQLPGSSPFALDPEIKSETVWSGGPLRAGSVQAQRKGPHLRVRDASGAWRDDPRVLATYESIVDEVADPDGAPEVGLVRRTLRGWRFHDDVRTDAGAPARAPHVGTRTQVLGHDGADLAAALATIIDAGGADLLDAAVDDAFPGSRIRIDAATGLFTLLLEQPGLRRPVTAAELSDGTLRYLVHVAALLSVRPAGLLVLDEPETGLHPDLARPLGRLVRRASERGQVLVVTHSRPLAEGLADDGAAHVRLTGGGGRETSVLDGREGALDGPAWAWPGR